jgi:hypothetical protein
VYVRKMQINLHALQKSAVGLVSVTLRPLLLVGKEPRYLLGKSLSGPHDPSGSDDEENNLVPV